MPINETFLVKNQSLFGRNFLLSFPFVFGLVPLEKYEHYVIFHTFCNPVGITKDSQFKLDS